MRALATDIPMTDSRHAAVFIAGTDTGIGKTHASCTLLHALRDAGHRSCGMKPVASGCAATPDGLRNDDALALQAAGSDPALAYERINPVALRDPLSPHLAAAREHRQVTLAPMRAAFEQLRSEHQRVVVEGVGGWLVPLAPKLFASDIARQWQLPVILVVGLRLGCLNHALLTQEAVAARGLRLAGWIANQVDVGMACVEENVEMLKARLEAPLLGFVPHQAAPDAARVAELLSLPD